MTDENKETMDTSGYGLSETPFAGYTPPTDEEPTAEVEATAEVAPGGAEEPEVVEAAEESAPAAEIEAEAEAPVAVETPEEPQEAPVQKEEPPAHVDYGDTFKTLSEGDVVGGVVVHVDREGVLVDVGAKSEGIIRPGELSRNQVANPEDVVQVGDKIDVYVMRSEGGHEDNLVLSKKRADFEVAWLKVEEYHKVGKVLTAMVTDRVKGGLVVDLGIRGFVPGSHVGSGKLKNLDKFVGQSIPLKVIEVDRERRKVVLSHRLAVEEDRESMRAKTLVDLKEGDIRDGTVRRMTDYGAFIDIGGIDGLLHISEMSWTRINHPSDMLKVGDHIQVMVLKLNLDQGRVSLGLRQILPDPWQEVARKYHVGDSINTKISRLVPFGAFVQIEGGVEGIIPNAEMAQRRVSKPEEVVSIGQEVEARIVDIRVEERRMTLSIRHLQQQRDREQVQSYTTQTKGDQRTTVGDLVGEALSAARRNIREDEPEKEAEKEQELEKPKAKKRPSKAERRALEEEATDVVAEELPAAEAVPEVVAETVETPAEAAPEAAVEAEAPAEAAPEAAVEAEPAAEAEVAAEAEPVAEAEPAVAEEPATETEATPEPEAVAEAEPATEEEKKEE